MKIGENSQQGKILTFMKSYPEISVDPAFFMKGTWFVGYEASARLSELKGLQLVEKVWKKAGTRMNLYRITQKGIDFQFSKKNTKSFDKTK